MKMIVLVALVGLASAAGGDLGSDYALDVVVTRAGQGTYTAQATNLVQNPDSSVGFDLRVDNNKAVWVNLRVYNSGTGKLVRNDHDLTGYFDNLLKPNGGGFIADSAIHLKAGQYVQVYAERDNLRSWVVNVLDGICMYLTRGSTIESTFWEVIFQDEELANTWEFLLALQEGDIFGAVEAFLGWASSESGRDRLIAYAQAHGLGWAREHVKVLCSVVDLALKAKTVLSYGWDTFFAPMSDQVILTAIPRYDVAWDALGPTQVNVNQATGIAIRVYNRGEATLHRVWLGMDIHDPTGVKVENTRTPIPDTGQGGTGRIGLLDFGDSTSGQGVEIPPGGYHIFGLKTPYRFRSSVTGHAYRGGVYQYHYFIWQNGYPGQPGAEPVNDDIAVTNLKVLDSVNCPTKPQLFHGAAGNRIATLGWAYNAAQTEWDIRQFRIYRSTSGPDGSSYALYDSVPVPVCAYVDTFVTNGVTYYYQVAAVNTAGYEGAFSSPLPCTPQAGGPSTPACLVATPGDATVCLRWRASEPGGRPLRSYWVYRGITSGGQGPSPFDSVLAPETGYTDTRVVNGTTYYYYVRATDNGSPPVLSDRSNEASATPSAGAIPPPTPAGLSATAGNRQVTLNWTANPPGTHRYRIHRSLSGGGDYALIDSVYHPTTTYVNSGLTNGMTYYYRLSAVNSAGQASALSGNVPAIPTPPNGSPVLSDHTTPSGVTEDVPVPFEVKYTDPDGNSPSYVRVRSTAGGSSVMVWSRPFPPDYRAGVIFYGGLAFPRGSQGFYFEASDGITTTRYPASGSFPLTVNPRPPEQPLELDSVRVSPKIISPLVSLDTADKCTLCYKLSAEATVKVEVLNSGNTVVRTVANWEGRAGGVTTRDTWNGRDNGNSPVPDGSYIFRVKASNFDEYVGTMLQGSIDLNVGDIAVDSTRDRVYIADYRGNVIRVYTRAGGPVRTFSSPYCSGIGVEYSTGYIYLAEFQDRRVRVCDQYGSTIRTLAPNGGGTGQFYNPIDVAVDVNGNLYVLATKNVLGNPCAILKYRNNLAFVSEDTCSTIMQQARVAVGRGYVAVTGLLGARMQFRDTNLVRRQLVSGNFGGVAVDQNGHVVVCNLQGHGGYAYKYDPATGELLVQSNPHAPHIAFPVLGVDIENPNYFLRACEARVIRTKNGWAQAAGRIVPIDPMQVQVDNSPPEAELMYPGAGDTLSDLVRTLGTAQDVNFKQYALEYYSSADGSWSLISSDTVSVDSGPLGDWNTNALPNGSYRLRLLTSDDAYNLDSAVFTVRVDHTPPGITLDTVFPTVFSPNGDGILDTTTMGYTLAKDALVTASVLDANSAVMRTLVNGQPRNAGPHTAKWDGKNNGGAYVSDGQYRLVLFASDSVNNPSVAETSVVSVDGAKPTVAITSPPNDSLASGLISFVGTATDANPLCRQMYYGTGASPDSWVRWDSTGSVVVDGLLAMFSTLNIADSIYTFRLVMDDQAGNRDSASVRLHVDNSLPEPPVLLSPHDTAAFPNRSVRFTWGSTRFAGARPLDADSVTYTFQLGRDFRFIACDTTVTLPAETTWQCPWSLADTTYYWHVRATDNAGNVGYYQNYPYEFVVDNVLPSVPVLIEPADSTIIGQDTTVTFRWFRSVENGSGIRGYVLRLSDSPEFVAYRDTLVRDTACVLGLADSLYYWKVNAVDRAGNTSGFTSPRMLVKDTAAPLVPALTQPADQSTINDSTPRFVWRKVSYQGGVVDRGMVGIHGTLLDEYGSPVRYTLECALDTEFVSGLVQVTGITDTAFDLPDSLALADTTYFWRVEAVDAAGHRSGFPDPWSFHIKAYFDVSGTVRYYSSQTPVESAAVVLSGFRSDTLYTNPTGAYAFLGFPVLQNYAVTPYRIEYSRQDAVSAYDAAMVLLHTVHRDTLDSLQFVAGDVTGDNTISPLDASEILQYTVGRIRHFRAGGDTVDWAFRPRQRTYVQPTQNQVNQDYSGILFGDPSGTWRPVGRVADDRDALAASRAAFYCLNLPDCGNLMLVSDVRGREADSPASSVVSPQVQAPVRQLVFPLALQNAAGVVSVDAEVQYCTGRLTLEGLRTTSATSGFMVAATDCDGLVRIAMAGSRRLNGTVTLLEMVFRVRDDNDAVARGTLVEMLSLLANEGRTNLGPRSEGAMDKETTLPSDVTLGPPLPNPAAGSMRIEYGLPKATSVRLSVFDVAGRPVRILVEQPQSAGRYIAVWAGEDNHGRRLPGGVYFLRMDADGRRIQRRAVLLGQ